MGAMRRRFSFVVPRYGAGIAGGAETLVGSLAGKLAERGDSVEVLTTCAKDNRTWENAFPPGTSVENGVTVRRFSVDPRDLEKWIPLQIAISEGMRLSIESQFEWLRESVNSSGLYEYIAEHAAEYEAIFFAPYLFGTTFWGSLISPANSYLIPCLHDENYAYVDVIQSMFRIVRGCLFNAIPERDLALSLYGLIPGDEVGMGFDPFPDNEEDSLNSYFQEKFPYILYVGRKETGKNVQLLIDYFVEGKNHGLRDDVKLVIVGGGSFSDLGRDSVLARGDVIDLSHVSERDKQRLIRHALYLCQPSRNESFSIVLMEAWLLRTPVVVHAGCPVTSHHVVESGGGLYFSTAGDLELVTKTMLEDEDLRRSFAMAGKEYVLRRYSWDAVLKRFDQVMEKLSTWESRIG